MDKTIKFFLSFLMVVISIWLFDHIQSGRYEIISVSSGDSKGAYKLDKWTGETTVLVGNREMDVRKRLILPSDKTKKEPLSPEKAKELGLEDR